MDIFYVESYEECLHGMLLNMSPTNISVYGGAFHCSVHIVILLCIFV